MYFMSRHFKTMLQHKTKLKGKKLCWDKEILCRDILQKKQRMKRRCNKVFMSRIKTLMSRQLQDKFSRTLSRQNSRRKHETMLQQKTTSHNKSWRTKMTNYVVTKQPAGLDFWGSTISALKCGPSFENL